MTTADLFLPSPPPCRMVDRVHNRTRTERANAHPACRPALPILMLGARRLPTSPMVARQVMSTRRISEEGMRRMA